jgi:pimeloyl-ACP methyl ester carboxylesterase
MLSIKQQIAILIVLVPLFSFAQADELNVLGNSQKFEIAKTSLFNHYSEKAFYFLEKRGKEIAQLNTLDDWQERQQKVKEILNKSVGPFPAKTPLNVMITGTVQKPEYRIEKIVFESQPRFYVTSTLFIPNHLKGKTAAIIFTSGHAQEAFRWPDYQQVILNLVEKGFIVFAFDPIGQGERVQYWNSKMQKSDVGDAVFEHSYVGAQCILAGSSLVRYMIWDGIRAVDYLLTREEVDPKRIGITGHSGGGTQAAYIAAFDERILAVAPECYITSSKRLWEGVGPQDAEQNLFHGIANGIDMADLLEIRAPKPALQITTTRDFFPIQGAIETENEVRRIYQAYGKEENFSRVEDDAPHSVTKKNREARNAFFQRQLGNPGLSDDREIEMLTETDLQITKTGQVSSSLGGETVYSLNRKEAMNHIGRLSISRKNSENHTKNCVVSAKNLSGYIEPAKPVESVFTGRVQRSGYSIEKHYLKGEGNYPIPFLLFLPVKTNGDPILYLNPSGKEQQAASGGEIEQLIIAGHPVLAADLAGFGEMGPNLTLFGDFGSNLGGISFKHWFGPVQTAQSQVGVHAADINRLVLFLKQRFDSQTGEILGIALDDYCPGLIHAASFGDLFAGIALIDPLISYCSIVTNTYYKADFLPPFVAGALSGYDLPDLLASFAPRKLLLVNIRNQMKNKVLNPESASDLQFVKDTYCKTKAPQNLTIVHTGIRQNVGEILSGWMD